MQFTRGAVDESIQTVQGQNHYLTVILRHHIPAVLEAGALRTLFFSLKARFYSDSIRLGQETRVIFHWRGNILKLKYQVNYELIYRMFPSRNSSI